MGLKGYRLWVMGQLDSTCRAPPRSIPFRPLPRRRRRRLLPLRLHEFLRALHLLESVRDGPAAPAPAAAAAARRRSPRRAVRALLLHPRPVLGGHAVALQVAFER
jgi:hypothetical protein